MKKGMKKTTTLILVMSCFVCGWSEKLKGYKEVSELSDYTDLQFYNVAYSDNSNEIFEKDKKWKKTKNLISEVLAEKNDLSVTLYYERKSEDATYSDNIVNAYVEIKKGTNVVNYKYGLSFDRYKESVGFIKNTSVESKGGHDVIIIKSDWNPGTAGSGFSSTRVSVFEVVNKANSIHYLGDYLEYYSDSELSINSSETWVDEKSLCVYEKSENAGFFNIWTLLIFDFSKAEKRMVFELFEYLHGEKRPYTVKVIAPGKKIYKKEGKGFIPADDLKINSLLELGSVEFIPAKILNKVTFMLKVEDGYVMVDDVIDWLGCINNTVLYIQPKEMVVKTNLRLRSEQGTAADIITTIKQGARVKVVELGNSDIIDDIESKWVKVEVVKKAKTSDGKDVEEGTTGWCFGGYLK